MKAHCPLTREVTVRRTFAAVAIAVGVGVRPGARGCPGDANAWPSNSATRRPSTPHNPSRVAWGTFRGFDSRRLHSRARSSTDLSANGGCYKTTAAPGASKALLLSGTDQAST